jgi:hypothetical protein
MQGACHSDGARTEVDDKLKVSKNQEFRRALRRRVKTGKESTCLETGQFAKKTPQFVIAKCRFAAFWNHHNNPRPDA